MTATTAATPSGPRRRRQVTIAYLAELTGVSVPTVSKVINGRSDVAPDTRRRVEAAIREHGYRRAEKPASRSDLVELIFHELASPWALEIVLGVDRAARTHGLAVVLSELEGRHTPGRGWVESAIARRPAGVIAVLSELTSAQLDQLATRSIPFVAIDPTGGPLHDTPSVGAANWNGGFTAARHLLDLGHRRIAMIGGPASIMCCRARLDGYRAAMDTAGVPVDEALVRRGGLHVEEGLAIGRELLALPQPPTAVFAANDLQAMGVYQAAGEADVRIPHDLSVVGFDDISVARWSSPPLTTIRQPLVDMAVAATNLLLALACGQRPAQTRIELATSLVVRRSTAPAPV